MNALKKAFKKNSHNLLFKLISDFGRSIYRIYENRNHHIDCNGESNVLRLLSKTNPKVIVDIGANEGEYSEHAAIHNPGSQIHAMEPVPSTYESLKKHVAAYENVKCHCLGGYKVSGSKVINYYKESGHSSLEDVSHINGAASRQIEIQLISGDEFMKQEGIEQIDFLKIDVEGVELDVLYGFEKAIANNRIKAIQFEYGNINIICKTLLYDFYQYFVSKGYVVGKVYPKYVDFRPYQYKHEDFIGPNFVAVLEEEKELIRVLYNK